MRKILSVLGICSLCFLFGCGREKYNIIVDSNGKKEPDLNNVIIKFNSFRFNFGHISPGKTCGYMGAGDEHPLPENATVSWETVKTKNDPNKDGVLPLKVVGGLPRDC
jgi:hypothetical protein